ncbi:MAG: ATP synthase subunit I [Deltaproteobacteria bacterium]|nr:ATP synthase subunit I [Deltaproteobacteria bacterium]
MKGDPEEQLLNQISQQNVMITIVYLVFSLFWSSLSITLSVFAGSLIAIFSYFWLSSTLQAVVGQQDQRSIKKYLWHYGIRIVAVGVVLFVLIFYVKVNPIALFMGLSVVVLSLFIGIFRYVTGR